MGINRLRGEEGRRGGGEEGRLDGNETYGGEKV